MIHGRDSPITVRIWREDEPNGGFGVFELVGKASLEAASMSVYIWERSCSAEPIFAYSVNGSFKRVSVFMKTRLSESWISLGQQSVTQAKLAILSAQP